MLMVWDRRFELLTSRTPCVRATWLRQSQAMYILYHSYTIDMMGCWSCRTKIRPEGPSSCAWGLFFAKQKTKTTANTQKRKCLHFLFTRILVVWVTGLEPATSTSQKSRATNCATPSRKLIIACFSEKNKYIMVE